MFDVHYAISVWYEFLTMDHFDHKKISDLKKKNPCAFFVGLKGKENQQMPLKSSWFESKQCEIE